MEKKQTGPVAPSTESAEPAEPAEPTEPTGRSSLFIHPLMVGLNQPNRLVYHYDCIVPEFPFSGAEAEAEAEAAAESEADADADA